MIDCQRGLLTSEILNLAHTLNPTTPGHSVVIHHLSKCPYCLDILDEQGRISCQNKTLGPIRVASFLFQQPSGSLKLQALDHVLDCQACLSFWRNDQTAQNNLIEILRETPVEERKELQQDFIEAGLLSPSYLPTQPS